MYVHMTCTGIELDTQYPTGVGYILHMDDQPWLGVHETEIAPILESIVGSRCTLWQQTTPDNARDFLAVGELVLIDR